MYSAPCAAEPIAVTSRSDAKTPTAFLAAAGVIAGSFISCLLKSGVAFHGASAAAFVHDSGTHPSAGPAGQLPNLRSMNLLTGGTRVSRVSGSQANAVPHLRH